MGVMRRSENAVIFSGSDKDKVSYCQDCLNVKVLSPLRHRIYLDEDGKITNPGRDADKWKQCCTCGLAVGVFEAKPEVELDTLTEPRDNPFKFGSGTRVHTGELRNVDRTGKTAQEETKARLGTVQGRGRKRSTKERQKVNFVYRNMSQKWKSYLDLDI